KLDPRKPVDNEDEMVRHWTALQRTSHVPNNYEEGLANTWLRIGCSADEAPYVLERLVEMLPDRFAPDSVELPKLAAAFLKEDCAGARGISEHVRMVLAKYRDAGPAKSSNQLRRP